MGCKFPMALDINTGQILRYDECKQKLAAASDLYGKVPQKAILNSGIKLIPCGRCTECKLAYASMWATRCTLESLQWNENWFVTLTYEPGEVPIKNKITGELVRGEAGEIHGDLVLSSPTLYKKDVQDFLKRLRKNISSRDGEPVRYYMCGEYGTLNARPHYHLIIFNLHLQDLTFYKLNSQKEPLFNSQTMEKLWGHGFVVIGQVNWNTCSYVARYVMKKATGDGKKHYKELGMLPEYTNMSLKPGIGEIYYQLNKEQIYQLDELILPDGKRVRPPRYYDKKYGEEEPEVMMKVKERREYIQKQNIKTKMQKSTESYWEQLKKEHEAKQAAYKTLVRNL